MRKTLVLILAALITLALFAQTPRIGVPQGGGLDLSDAALARPTRRGTALPGSCVVGEYFFKEDAAAGQNTYACTAANTWTLQGDGGSGGGDGLPAGAIVMIASGTCPSGFAEETALGARMPLGTLAANSDVGTTGGADDITPAGAVASATTGIAIADHATANTSTSGGNRAFSNTGAAAHSITDNGHTHGFTGTQFDNRSAFLRVIFCRKT